MLCFSCSKPRGILSISEIYDHKLGTLSPYTEYTWEPKEDFIFREKKKQHLLTEACLLSNNPLIKIHTKSNGKYHMKF